MLYYTVVAREGVVLAEHTVAGSDDRSSLSDVVKQYLHSTRSQLRGSIAKDSRVYESYKLHCYMRDDIIAIVVASSSYSVQQSYQLLEEIVGRFTSSSGLVARSKNATELQLNREFNPVLQQLTNEYSRSRGKIGQAHAEVDQVREVLIQNAEKLTERGENLKDLEDRTNELSNSSRSFRGSAIRVRKKFWWKNVKLWFSLGAVVAVIIVVIVVFGICNPNFSKCS